MLHAADRIREALAQHSTALLCIALVARTPGPGPSRSSLIAAVDLLVGGGAFGGTPPQK